MSIKENLLQVKGGLPGHVKLVAVSKTRSPQEILEAYNAGQQVFGENKAQELSSKYEELPKDIEWHMIGHLQRNKVKYIAPFVSLIHSIDSPKLLRVVDKEGEKNNRCINCLLQVKIAREETKHGFAYNELQRFLGSEEVTSFKHVRITGLMGMSTFTDNMDTVRSEFQRLKEYFDLVKNSFFPTDTEFKELSMGMSGDYQLAIECGSTIVRVGSLIFGERSY